MLTKILAGVAILSSSVAFLSHQHYQQARTELVAAQSKIKGLEEYAAFTIRLRAANTTWDTVEKDLGSSDEPLSDYLAGVSGRLWP